jgi:D-glycero-D-manno-heptose 1,7-bisphosphate phosphatase
MATCLLAMEETQRQTDNAFDGLLWCAHHPNATDPEMAVCWCRKPRPGLIIEGALLLSERHDEIYPPHLGLFVGDRPEDEECANAANLKFMPADIWRTGKHLKAQGVLYDK